MISQDITILNNSEKSILPAAIPTPKMEPTDTWMVTTDIALIERVFQNLIANALRYTAAGGKIIIDIQERQKHFEVSVEDNGMGIAQEHLAHVFERYWRVQDAKNTEPGPSSGLGLAIVKRILELHSSVIRVTSALEQGTSFHFTLARAPLAPAY